MIQNIPTLLRFNQGLNLFFNHTLILLSQLLSEFFYPCKKEIKKRVNLSEMKSLLSFYFDFAKE